VGALRANKGGTTGHFGLPFELRAGRFILYFFNLVKER
jgi:hypothetical protein